MFKPKQNNLFDLEFCYNSRYREFHNYIKYICEHDEADLDDLRVIYGDLLDLTAMTFYYIGEKMGQNPKENY